MIRKSMLAAVAASALICATASAAHAETWMALALNEYGAGYAEARTEAQAKVWALENCRDNTDEQCYATVSVPLDWFLVGVYCGGEPSVAASQWSYARAEDLAAQKLGYSEYDSDWCWVSHNY